MGSPEKRPDQQMAFGMPSMLLALAALWSVAFLAVGGCCQWLAMQHVYGVHSRAQVALAFGLCCLCATWVLAEFIRRIEPLKNQFLVLSDDEATNGQGSFQPVPVTEPESIGAASPADMELAEVSKEASPDSVEPGDDLKVVQLPADSKLQLCLRNLDAGVPALRSCAEMSAIVAFMYLCDRTDVFSKGKKFYDPQQFWALWALICLVALCTVRKLDNAKPLQREQTDEWKGWMQLMFLLYHYFAEKEVYNAIRVYIAAYVFMTGFGNFSLYAKGKSFTTRRTLQMLFRLNFLGFVVCVALNNEYMLYYICAMHTLFTVLVIIALYIKQDLNTSTPALYTKIGISFVVTLLVYDTTPQVFSAVFGTLPVVRPLFAFHDPLHPEFTDEMHEFHFRSGLDRFVWIVGMLFAMCVPKFMQLFEKLQALEAMERCTKSAAVGMAVLLPFGLWVYYVFMLDKFTYNAVHPFTSFLPIAAYLVLRNLLACFRERYLFLFAYLGRYTLETYILQFHVWMKTTGLNGSPRHLLTWIPGNYYANFVVVSAVYLFVSVRFMNLTIVIRDVLIPEDLRSIGKRWAVLSAAVAVCWGASYIWL